MRAFRRTRTYGCLYRLKRPKPEDLGQILWLGSTYYERGRYHVRSALLDSIPEDKSPGLTPAQRWMALIRELKPDGWDAVGRLCDAVPRDLVHKTAIEAEIL